MVRPPQWLSPERGPTCYWLVLTTVNAIVAAVFLFTGLNIGHVLERNNINGRPLMERFLRRQSEVLDISAIETVFGIAWLLIAQGMFLAAIARYIISNVVLFVGLFVEHRVSFSKRPLP